MCNDDGKEPLAATASESIGAIKVVRALSLEDNFQHDFARRNQKSLSEGVKTSRLAAKLERTIDLLVAVATALVLWRGTHFVLAGELSPGELVVFLTYLKRGFRPLQDVAKYTARLAKATAAGERVLELLEQTPDVCESPEALAATSFEGSVTFQRVCFSYDPKKAVFEDLDFHLPVGSRAAFVGPSGIGKSTLIALLLRMHDPSAGTVRIDGMDIRNYTLQSLRAQIERRAARYGTVCRFRLGQHRPGLYSGDRESGYRGGSSGQRP